MASYQNAFDCFPGCSTAKSLRMLKLMNVATISERTFYRHTCSYLNAVIQLWKKHQQDLIGGFLEKNDGLILAGDGRCDCPGYSAKFGSFTLIEQRINRVVACVTARQNRQYSPSAQRLPKACSDIPLFVYSLLIG